MDAVAERALSLSASCPCQLCQTAEQCSQNVIDTDLMMKLFFGRVNVYFLQKQRKIRLA